MKKQILLDKSYSEIQAILENGGFKKFRAKQLFEGLYLGKSIDEMTNIPNDLKDFLLKKFYNHGIELIKHQKSKDGTQKFLFKLNDGEIIESVLMRYKYGNSVCVSSQVGCKMRCSFCVSGVNGLIRDLTSGEIIAQVVYINKHLNGGLTDKRQIKNVVIMGIGEPLDNFDNTVKFIDNIGDERGLNVSQRNITLSTCGIISKIRLLADLGYGVTLTLSLHSARNDIRQDIMPVAKSGNVKQLLEACKYYFEKTKRRVSLEYIMIEDLTVTKKQALELVKLLKGEPFHLNLINLNKNTKNKYLEPAKPSSLREFTDILSDSGINYSIRRELGKDIDAACGQLKSKLKKDSVN